MVYRDVIGPRKLIAQNNRAVPRPATKVPGSSV